MKRIHIFTGKGGTGKTSLSLATYYSLKERGIPCRWISFESTVPESIKRDLGQDLQILTLEVCLKEYLVRKIRSKVVASWVVKVPFLKALTSLVPSFGYLLYLGYLIEQAKELPGHHLILDSPSSGHAMTMLESVHNFREIFSSGSVVEDIDRLVGYAKQEELIDLIICALPTQMAANEAKELLQDLDSMDFLKARVLLNSSYHKRLSSDSSLPPYFQAKWDQEKEVHQLLNSFILCPFLPSSDYETTLKGMVPFMKELQL